MLRQRILTVAVLLPLFLAALFLLPNLYWSLLLVAVLAVAAQEWARLAGMTGLRLRLYPAVLCGLALAILVLEHRVLPQPLIHAPSGRLLYGLCVVFWLCIAPAWLYYRWRTRNPLLLGMVGALVLVPFWHALSFLQPDPGRLAAVLAVVWIADTAAYFTGRKLGRRKLAPEISPGKTLEGAAGALAAVAAYWYALALWAPGVAGDWPSGLVLFMILTLVSIEGDLFESWMKRVAGLKDSGTLLPGHGGVLDRVDALTSTVPLAALYFAYPALRG